MRLLKLVEPVLYISTRYRYLFQGKFLKSRVRVAPELDLGAWSVPIRPERDAYGRFPAGDLRGALRETGNYLE